jgi:hypothetical protein
LENENVVALERMAKTIGLPLSVILRELIPSVPIADAMLLREKAFGGSGRGVPSSIPNACISLLLAEMKKNPAHDCELQMELFCGSFVETAYEEAPDYFDRIALFYQMWVRAENSMEGYRFETVLYKGKATFPIVIKYTDKEEVVESWKKRIVEYAEKLGR